MDRPDRRIVYVLRSKRDPTRHYVGLTANLSRRLACHNAGQNIDFFWTGRGSVRTITTNWARYLSSVFEESGVAGAHSHRFRDTFAVELLLAGVPIDQVSMLLGHASPGQRRAVVRILREVGRNAGGGVNRREPAEAAVVRSDLSGRNAATSRQSSDQGVEKGRASMAQGVGLAPSLVSSRWLPRRGEIWEKGPKDLVADPMRNQHVVWPVCPWLGVAFTLLI